MPSRLVVAASLVLAMAVPASTQSPAQSYAYRQKSILNACRPPLKFAAGACVRRCPAGYQDDGRYCRLRNQRF